MFIYFLYLFCTVYPDMYFGQETPCLVMNEFIMIPLPENNKIIIEPQNYNKLSMFSIKVFVIDPSKTYEKILIKYLLDNEYKYCQYDLYKKDEIELKISRINNKLIFHLRKQVKGVFTNENN